MPPVDGPGTADETTHTCDNRGRTETVRNFDQCTTTEYDHRLSQRTVPTAGVGDYPPSFEGCTADGEGIVTMYNARNGDVSGPCQGREPA